MKYISRLKTFKVNTKKWILVEDFVFIYKGKTYVVPKGFPTDLATIPVFASYFFKPDGDYKESAVIHDWFLKKMYDGDTSITRRYASKVFLESLIYQKIPFLEIVLLYSGVKTLDLLKFIEKELLK